MWRVDQVVARTSTRDGHRSSLLKYWALVVTSTLRILRSDPMAG